MPKKCLEDLVASDCVSLNLHFDWAHEADEHSAISQFVKRAWLRKEHLKHFHEHFKVEEVNPEASLNDFLILFCFRSVKYALESYLYWSKFLFLQLSKLFELLL